MAQISNGELGSSVRGKLNAMLELDVSIKTGTTYTLQDADMNTMVIFTNSSPVTVSVPAGLADNFLCVLMQGGAGAVTVAASGGAILNSYAGLVNLAGRYAVGNIFMYDNDTFLLSGMLG